MDMKKNVLIIYTAVGKGHKSMAENVGAAIEADYNVDFLDLFRTEDGVLTRWGTTLYLWVLDVIPSFWNFLYTSDFILNLTIPLRTKFAGFKSAKVLSILKSKNYDIIISTQVNPSAIISYLKSKGLYQGKFVISFSDYHLQRFWLFENADLYLVNIPEQKTEMAALGYDPSKIFVVGMALPAKQALDKQSLRLKYGFKADDKVILMMSGTMGYQLRSEAVQNLLETGAKVLVVCGNNKKVQVEMQAQFKNNQDVKIFGFVDFMDELYAISDLVVTKPGGLTTAEVLSNHLPLAVSTYLPGQEKINTEYLRNKNLVLPETNNLVKQIQEEFETKEFSQQLRNNVTVKIITQDGSTVKQAIDQL